MLVACGILQLPAFTVTQECSKDLASAGMFFLRYYFFFIARNVCIGCVLWVSKDPMHANVCMRATFWVIDWIALSVGVIWATFKYANEESERCGLTDYDVDTFRDVLLAQIIFGYLYLVRIYIFMCFGCLLSFVHWNSR